MPAAKTKSHPYTQSDRPLVYAHRGGALLAPENTMAAFDQAVKMGVDGLEIDIAPSADGEPMVIHDLTVDRTCSGHGKVGELTAIQLRELDAGHHFTPDGGKTYPFRGTGVTIPTLDEVLGAYPRTRVNIEFKGTQPGFEERVKAVIDRHGATHRVLACSASGWINRRVREKIPDTAHGADEQDMVLLWVALKLGLEEWAVPPAHALQLPPSHLSLTVITPRLVEFAHRHGMAVHVWTINDAESQRHFYDWGLDAVMSDVPDVLLRVRDEYLARHRAGAG